MNILVTGAGSLIGHGVLRSIRKMAKQDLTVFTADPDYRAAGHWLGDHAVTIPVARNDYYIEVLASVVDRHKIDLVFIGTDPELYKISSALDKLKTTVVVSKPNVIALGDDKLETARYLQANNFPYPDSSLARNKTDVDALIARVGFPLIAKPRVGARSAGLTKVNSAADLPGLDSSIDYVLQEYLPDDPGEFTAGTMTYDGKCYSQVIFRRDLKDGNTYRAYTYSNAAHSRFLKDLSEKIPGVYGPLNFQYRVRNGTPVVFEINSRFSGTTPLRTAIGINEVEMAIEYFRSGDIKPRNVSIPDVAILRTWSDIIVPTEQLEQLKKTGELKSPSASYFPFHQQ